MPIPSLDELMTMEVGSWSNDVMPLGKYSGVITNIEVRQGKKGPYLNLEVTCHDEEYVGRKVWRNSSFSEKAIGAPAGIAELVQATKPEVPQGTSAQDLPSALALACHGSPVGFEVDHEQRWKDGAPVVDPATGEPVMRETISAFFPASDDFIQSVENEAAGVDEDLPF